MFYRLAPPFPVRDVLSDSLRLFLTVSIMIPFATPLNGGAQVPLYLVGDVVAF